MKRIRIWAVIAWTEILQWKYDYRIWMVFALEAMLVMRSLVGLGIYGLVHHTHVTPWVMTLLFTDLTIAKSVIKILLYFGLIVLFCNAPSISRMTPSVLLRGKRNGWMGGMIFYIFSASLLYTGFLFVLSFLCVLPSVSVSEIWGSSLYRLENGDVWERFRYVRTLLFPGQVMKKIYPEYALGYTLLTGWLSFSFLGLLILAVNLVSRQKEWGVALAGGLVMLDPVIAWFGSWGPAKADLFLYSPVSWSSMEHLASILGAGSLSVSYVIAMYLLLIFLLVLFILWKVRKREIEIL